MRTSLKSYSQKVYLFVIYGTFMLILLAIFFIFTYSHYQSNTLKESAGDLKNMCASVENSLSAQLDILSTISMNIVYSNALKTNFKEFSVYGPDDYDSSEQLVATRQHVRAIHDIITAMIGAYQTAAKINIYTMDGAYVESGYWQRSGTVNLAEMPWYEEVMERKGYKFIAAPATQKDLPAKSQFISLVRMFLDADGNPEGIVEVVQDCDIIFSLAAQLEQQNRDSLVYIYNERYELVYPYLPDQYPSYQYSELDQPVLYDGNCDFIQSSNGDSFLATRLTVPEYEWTVFLMKPQTAVYASLGNFRMFFSLISLGSILFTMGICFYISERLTKPLRKLTEATGKITLDRVLDEKKVNLTSADSNITELSQLCESIRSMYEKLRTASQDVLLSKSEETRAKLQATQSLVNPHFLYNCLTSISIMAEEGSNDTIVSMCQALCDYFRYISSSPQMMVPLEDEIFNTHRYLECMQLRFSEELSYQLKIDENAKHLAIPKLIIQPLVENAFKYAFNIKPPWKLTITAEGSNEHWLLKVTDNGGQLSEEKKEELLEILEKLNLNQELHSLQIGGMGLKNVYLRLKLLYGEQAVFRIETDFGRATTFVLGGATMSTGILANTYESKLEEG